MEGESFARSIRTSASFCGTRKYFLSQRIAACTMYMYVYLFTNIYQLKRHLYAAYAACEVYNYAFFVITKRYLYANNNDALPTITNKYLCYNKLVISIATLFCTGIG